ncbi:DUF1772 domain-containing protein [Actinoallomurus iriomotensis]|uniref:DUF1772 domain-containing protein n=1 Tax=Actinoallomurus iriomotensis TaxID=478107 RepID=A0A9W6VKP2_9ACTN|nr:DUF1772 domain-containing protein [Actinoallomurus iriomotensis]GLY75503.1 hypothetical protein Airi01_037700 [Actinoallomurus iriomotensis]GLY85114.1 hypothetical protein Airi02_030430 [Actinoallomurus iriomotensis]
MFRVLTIVALIGSGTTTGVLFGVAVSVVPALLVMAPDNFVYTHQLLGRNWDPVMPAIVLGSTAADVVLAVLADGTGQSTLYGAAAVLLFGVSVVSHLCNVPINRQIKAWRSGALPDDWQDPRPRWRNWHLLRTALAILALTVNSLAVTLG